MTRSNRFAWTFALKIAVCALAAAAAAATRPSLAGRGDWKVAPGPLEISSEEKAIQPDPARQMQHLVVLLEETDRDERGMPGWTAKVSYHLRAKVLSAEGRSIGDLVLEDPARGDSPVTEFWAISIGPDGKKSSMQKSDLKEQGEGSNRTLRGVIPGIEPGSIVDFGYTMYRNVRFLNVQPIQRTYPVRELRYRWWPDTRLNHTVRSTLSDDLDVDIRRDGQAIVLQAKNLPAVPQEPFMPAEQAVRAAAYFYYPLSGIAPHYGVPSDLIFELIDRGVIRWDSRLANTKFEPDAWWKEEARRFCGAIDTFAEKDAVAGAIQDLGDGPAGESLESKLRRAYGWLGSKLVRTDRMTAEQYETGRSLVQEFVDWQPRGMKQVLASKAALPWQMAFAYIAMARGLGAQADPVLVTDRTERYLDQWLMTMGQFDTVLVAVRAPGEPDEKAVIVDPGSGLPYGEVPWYYTGAPALLFQESGTRRVSVPAAGIDRNVLVSQVHAELDDDGEIVSWTKKGTGQQGYEDRLQLRRMRPDRRQDQLELHCGGGGELHVTKAEAPGLLGDPSGGFEIACEAETTVIAPAAGAATWTVGFEGPWIGEIPLFVDTERAHPAIFDFSKIDKMTFEVKAPDGYALAALPPPIHIEERFGRYKASFAKTDDGFRVEREFMFGPLIVMPDEYGDLRAFLQNVRKADKTMVDLVKAGSGS